MQSSCIAFHYAPPLSSVYVVERRTTYPAVRYRSRYYYFTSPSFFTTDTPIGSRTSRRRGGHDGVMGGSGDGDGVDLSVIVAGRTNDGDGPSFANDDDLGDTFRRRGSRRRQRHTDDEKVKLQGSSSSPRELDHEGPDKSTTEMDLSTSLDPDHLIAQASGAMKRAAHARGIELIGVLCVQRPKKIGQREGRRGAGAGTGIGAPAAFKCWVDAGTGVDPQQLADVSVDLRNALFDAWRQAQHAYVRAENDSPPRLEVTTPGRERPLFSPQDCRRFIGRRAQLTLSKNATSAQGRRKLVGKIINVEGGDHAHDDDPARAMITIRDEIDTTSFDKDNDITVRWTDVVLGNHSKLYPLSANKGPLTMAKKRPAAATKSKGKTKGKGKTNGTQAGDRYEAQAAAAFIDRCLSLPLNLSPSSATSGPDTSHVRTDNTTPTDLPVLVIPQVVLFVKSYCPYCRRALKLLRDMGLSLVPYDDEVQAGLPHPQTSPPSNNNQEIPASTTASLGHNPENPITQEDTLRSSVRVVALEDRPNMDAIQTRLREITGAYTVPRVFIGGVCMGGASELEQMAKTSVSMATSMSTSSHADTNSICDIASQTVLQARLTQLRVL